MSKLAIITLRSRAEIVGSDIRFNLKTSDFEGSYTNTLARGVGYALLVQEDEETGNFVLPALGDEISEIRIHKSWAASTDYPFQTADDLVGITPEDTSI